VAEMVDSSDYRLSGLSLVEAVAELRASLVARGVGKGCVIALELERTPGLLVAMLATMESGAAFLPIDPSLPELRKAYMIEDSGARFQILDRRAKDPASSQGEPPLQLDFEIAELRGLSRESTTMGVSESVAYVLYTSGSSGRPKGVMISHRSLRNVLHSMASNPGLEKGDVLLATTTISFDIALLELLLPLLQGAKLVLAPDGFLRDVQDVANALTRFDVTVMQATPTTWRMLAATGWQGKENLRVWSGGEHLSRDLANFLLGRVQAVWNLYGPTETTIWSMVAKVVPGEAVVDLGEPIENTHVALLDRYGRHAPRNVPAELVIGGAGVALGYTSSEEGEEVFCVDAVESEMHERAYRTGDLVRLGDDNLIRYVGRKDSQVKLRGIRLELSEVERVLGEHENVTQAAVKVCAIDGVDELVAYVVVSGDVRDEHVLSAVQTRLPKAQTPKLIVRLESLPTTFNGKLDRSSLPDPRVVPGFRRGDGISPSVVEQIVTQVWAAALSVPSVGVRDNFFSLGGHSLNVIAAIAGINRAFGTSVPLARLFQFPTPLEFARELEIELKASGMAAQNERTGLCPVLTRRGEPQPLSSGQQRLWYVTQLDPGERPYVLAAAVRLRGVLDVAALSAAFESIQHRHSVLRTIFREEGGKPMQVVQADTSLHLKVVAAPAGESDVSLWVRQEINRLINLHLPLRGDVPARASLIRESPDEHVLLLMIHHILVDEWALGLLIQDLGIAYEEMRSGKVVERETGRLDFVDFAVAEQARLEANGFSREIAYWREKLADAPITSLPSRQARPNVPVFRGGNLTSSIPGDLYSSIVRLARSRAVTPFVVLLTGFLALLQRYLARADLCVGIMDSGRDDPSVENIVGPFARPLALRVEFGGETPFSTHLEGVQKTLIEGWVNRDAPFEQVVNSVGASRKTNINPMFQIMIVMQNMRGMTATFDGVTVEPVAVDTAIAEFDLMIEMFETCDGLTIRFSYNSNLYTKDEIDLLARRYESVFWVVTDDPSIPISAIDLLQRDEAV
jgi:amino acid adenylation domain-containing protein